MQLLPLKLLWDRIERDRNVSDTDLFAALMYLGEAVTKLAVSGMLGAISNDRDRARYAISYELVRADGIGDWGKALSQIVKGETSKLLAREAYTERNELIQRVESRSWQYESIQNLLNTCNILNIDTKPLAARTSGHVWFNLFAALRNGTLRGHGAPPPRLISEACSALEASLRGWTDNFYLFKRDWIHLYRNVSGKPVIQQVCGARKSTKEFGSDTSLPTEAGTYIIFDVAKRVELLFANMAVNDFFYPNGGFNSRDFELLSYVSGETKRTESKPYLTPPDRLPASETHGDARLEVWHEVLTNSPRPLLDLVPRQILEDEVEKLLLDDRWPVITLSGKGGIGKTSLALSVIETIARSDRFDLVLWFSARDIDLLPEGPRRVRPDVVSIDDIAAEYCKLVGCPTNGRKDSRQAFADALSNDAQSTTLFVFDNFETIHNPDDVYQWCIQYIRPKNKALITTKLRNFKGDYCISVKGMLRPEAMRLIEGTAKKLGIRQLLDQDYIEEIIAISDGHPYVIKILLNEVRKHGKKCGLEKILASQDEVLDALFERTYLEIKGQSQRIFLTLCNWKSVIPVAALEAVMLRPGSDRIDLTDALDELEQSSLIDVIESEADHQPFVVVPMAAQVFGKGKTEVSPHRAAVYADTKELYLFGAAKLSDVRQGLRPRISSYIKNIAKQLEDGERQLEDVVPTLEFFARRDPYTWLQLSRLYLELKPSQFVEKSKNALRRMLEQISRYDTSLVKADLENLELQGWRQLVDLCRDSGDIVGELNALVSMCKTSTITVQDISSAADRLNQIFARKNEAPLPRTEKQLLAQELRDIFAKHRDQISANDHSRLAWLSLHINDRKAAEWSVKRGLQLDPDNRHLRNLALWLAGNRY